jgi:hypothetical protein
MERQTINVISKVETMRRQERCEIDNSTVRRQTLLQILLRGNGRILRGGFARIHCREEFIEECLWIQSNMLLACLKTPGLRQSDSFLWVISWQLEPWRGRFGTTVSACSDESGHEDTSDNNDCDYSGCAIDNG